jgi:O-antigen/teichoic acid export membrane protein
VPPMIAELHAQGRKEQLERMLRGAATLAGVPAFLGLLVLVLFGPWILGLVYGPFYEQGGFILRVLAAARVISVWAGTCGLTLMMTGHQRSMMYISVLSGFLSVGGGLLLSARYGGNGVAVATASTIVLQTVLMLVTARARVGVWTNVVLTPKRLLRVLKG